MNTGEEGWEDGIVDFSKLEEPKKENDKYRFRNGATYDNFVRQVSSQGYIDEYYGE